MLLKCKDHLCCVKVISTMNHVATIETCEQMHCMMWATIETCEQMHCMMWATIETCEQMHCMMWATIETCEQMHCMMWAIIETFATNTGGHFNPKSTGLL